MFLIVLKDGTAQKIATAEEAAKKSLSLVHKHVWLDSTLDRRAFINAHDALICQYVQRGIGF
jgi:hypothetical protein